LPTDLARSLQRTVALRARFQQRKHLRALRDTLLSTGTIAYRRGGALVWHTDSPGESDLVLDGTSVTFTVSGMSSPQRIDLSSDPGMAKVFDTLRAVLEGNVDRLTPVFDIRVSSKQPLRVALTPRSDALTRSVEEIDLEFDAEFRLRRVSLREPDGDRTEIAFSDHVIETAGG
jgi:outer membrane lipoprotein-sorting protein